MAAFHSISGSMTEELNYKTKTLFRNENLMALSKGGKCFKWVFSQVHFGKKGKREYPKTKQAFWFPVEIPCDECRYFCQLNKGE